MSLRWWQYAAFYIAVVKNGTFLYIMEDLLLWPKKKIGVRCVQHRKIVQFDISYGIRLKSIRAWRMHAIKKFSLTLSLCVYI